MATPRIEYSEKYMDSNFEYRHVVLPKEVAKTLPQKRLLAEEVTSFFMFSPPLR
jgi:cyclin-dependent kinase regulatory subunit CKS1